MSLPALRALLQRRRMFRRGVPVPGRPGPRAGAQLGTVIAGLVRWLRGGRGVGPNSTTAAGRAAIANQPGAGDVWVGDRQGSVRNKRTFWLNSLAARNMTGSVFRICQEIPRSRIPWTGPGRAG